MANDHDEHKLMQQIRHMRGFDETVPLEQVYLAEVSRFALRSQHDRAADLMDLDERAKKIEETERVGLRQKAQIHRYRSHLSHAHAQLKKVGR
jgi:hypothetical protein